MRKLFSNGFRKSMRRGMVLILTFFLAVSAYGVGTIQSRAEESGDSASNNYGLRSPRIAYNYRDTVIFGNYRYDDTNGDGEINENDEIKPIVWQILKKYEDGTALVLADKVLDQQPYNNKEVDGTYACDWSTSSIRKWLNGTFYYKAFTNSEKSAISEVNVSNIDISASKVGDESNDRLFLLSEEELTRTDYGFNADSSYYDEARISLKSKQINDIFPKMIWVYRQSVGTDNIAKNILDGAIGFSGIANSPIGIRPACRIDLKSSYVKKGDKVKISVKGTEWDSVLFGKYDDKDIKWRVLNVSGDDAFLLSDSILTSRACNESSGSKSDFEWIDCDLRQWLNNDFYSSVFSEKEKAMIKSSKIQNIYTYSTRVFEGKESIDKVYLLSVKDLFQPSYGFANYIDLDSITRVAVNSANIADEWLIRQCHNRGGQLKCGYIDSKGNHSYGQSTYYSNAKGIRPCLHIDLSSSAWKKGEAVHVGDPSGGTEIPLDDKDRSDIPMENPKKENNEENKTSETSDTPSNPSSPTQSSNGVAKKAQSISGVKNITKTYSTKKFSLKAVTDGNGKLTYVSSNKKVATVSADGKVKLIGAGKTKITVKASGTSSYTPAEKTITLTVKRSKQKITSKVKTKTMTYTSTPFNLGTKVQGNAKVTYKSSNPKVLTVSSKGKVTLKGIGKATITIKTKQNAKYAAGTKKIVINVKAPKVKLLKCTALSDCRVKLSWTGAPVFDGYEIQFSLDSKFSEGYTPIDFKKKENTTILRGGVEGRTYYVRIRPYKKVNGKKVTYAWSNVSSFKTFK